MRKILVLALVSLLPLAPLSAAAGDDGAGRPFLLLQIEDKIIGPVTADYILEGIRTAGAAEYQGVLIELDTPGGLLESTRAIVKGILNAPLPVVVYVAPSGARAGSAGVFITLAAHVAAMAPATNIGAAHPVTVGEAPPAERALKKAEELTDNKKTAAKKGAAAKEPAAEETADPMQDKILNDTTAWIATIAKSRGRNAAWARQAVRESVSATEKEALELHVIDLTALDRFDLMEKLDGRVVSVLDKKVTLRTRGAGFVTQPMSVRQNILSTIIHPNIAYIFMLLGVVGLFIEITHPGVVLPGIAGVICLIVAFYAFAILPVNYAGVLLIAVGLVLFVAEALTPATFGLLTLGGVLAMVLGSLMLFNSPFLGIKVSLGVILPFVVAIAGIVLFLASRVVKAHRAKAQTGPEALVGAAGTAETDIAPEGQVFVNGELWTAVSRDGSKIGKGEKITVTAVDKIKLVVSK
ncbi:MAG: NfeD family protein [Deltaproteobacteria bacterium]